MSESRKRPVVGSRQATARPRKVASGSPAAPPTPSAPAGPVSEPTVVPERSVRPAPGPRVDAAPRPASEPVTATPRRSLLGSRRTTAALVLAIVLLAAAAAGESWYLFWRGGPEVTVAHPVVTGEMAHRAAVEAATQDTQDILSTSYKNYDDQVKQATSEMTTSFAKQYQQTVDQIRDDFVASKTELQVKVVAAGVVQASEEKVQALLFLNQYVTKPGHKTAFTPYRALVTVVHTAHGWLVDDIQTQ
ncbi:MAG: hypothetical protein ACXVWY_08490 [Nocardioides sp.]